MSMGHGINGRCATNGGVFVVRLSPPVSWSMHVHVHASCMSIMHVCMHVHACMHVVEWCMCVGCTCTGMWYGYGQGRVRLVKSHGGGSLWERGSLVTRESERGRRRESRSIRKRSDVDK